MELEMSHHSRIVSGFSEGEMICFGDDGGCIFVVEGDVLRRRFSRPVEEKEEDEGSLELRRKYAHCEVVNLQWKNTPKDPHFQ